MPFISGVNINISLDFDLVLPRVFARLSSCWARFDRVGYGVFGAWKVLRGCSPLVHACVVHGVRGSPVCMHVFWVF